MSQQPPTPRQRKVQEALNLFAQLQEVPFATTDDEQRVRHAANLERQQQTTSAPASSASLNVNVNSKVLNGNNILRKGTGSGGGAAPTVATTKQLTQQVAELQRKLALSDAIMKKLHRRNKELALEAEQLKLSGGVNGLGAGDNSKLASQASGTTGELSASNLKSIIARRDQEIIALKKQLALTQQGSSGGGTVPPSQSVSDSADQPHTTTSTPRITTTTNRLAITNASHTPSPSPHTNNYSIPMPSTIPAEAHVGLLHKRIDSLQKDYQALLDAKLEAIAQGENTGKVNKQVKVFFAAVKAKMATDVADYEAERVLWHQRLSAVMSK